MSGYGRDGAPIRSGLDGIDYGDGLGNGSGRADEVLAVLWAVWMLTGWPMGSAAAVVWLLRALPADGPHRVGLLPVALMAIGLTLAVLVTPIAARLLLVGLAHLTGRLLARLVTAIAVHVHRLVRSRRTRWTQRRRHHRRELLVHVQVVDIRPTTLTIPTTDPVPTVAQRSVRALPASTPVPGDAMDGIGVPIGDVGMSRTR